MELELVFVLANLNIRSSHVVLHIESSYDELKLEGRFHVNCSICLTNKILPWIVHNRM